MINIEYYGIKKYLFSNNDKLLRIDECKVFKNCEQILILGVRNMSIVFMQQLIEMVNELDTLKHCNLERIVLDQVLHNNMVIDIYG